MRGDGGGRVDRSQLDRQTGGQADKQTFMWPQPKADEEPIIRPGRYKMRQDRKRFSVSDMPSSIPLIPFLCGLKSTKTDRSDWTVFIHGVLQVEQSFCAPLILWRSMA